MVSSAMIPFPWSSQVSRDFSKRMKREVPRGVEYNKIVLIHNPAVPSYGILFRMVSGIRKNPVSEFRMFTISGVRARV